MVKISVFPQGTWVRVRRGRHPLDPATEGRVGLVVGNDRTVPDRVRVQLHGEDEIRIFIQDELEVEKRTVGIDELGSPAP